MSGQKVREYKGPIPLRDKDHQVADFPPDPRDLEGLCRFAASSLKDMVPALDVEAIRQEISK